MKFNGRIDEAENKRKMIRVKEEKVGTYINQKNEARGGRILYYL